MAAGFDVVGFKELKVTESRYHLAENEGKFNDSKS